MVVVTIGVKPAHLEWSDSTMGPVLSEFHYLLIIVTVAKGQIENFNYHFCFQNNFNIEISGNQIQICPNILQQRMQWVVLNIQCILLDDFLKA